MLTKPTTAADNLLMQCTVLYPHLSEAGTKGPENLLQGGGPPLLLLLAFCHIFLSNRALPPAETASPATCWRACTTTQSSHWQVFSTPRMRARCQVPQTRWGTGMKLLVAAGDSNSKPAAAGYRLPANTNSNSTTSTTCTGECSAPTE